MVIDINPILKGEKTEIDVCFELSLEDVIDDIEFSDNSSVSGYVKDMAGYITLSLKADAKYRTHCARCLADISCSKTIVFEKTVVTDVNQLQNDENDDYIIAEDGFLDVNDALTEQVLLETPMKHLCREDCKGLCPKCGKDLNAEPCNCDTAEPDPRFEVLRKLLESNKKD